MSIWSDPRVQQAAEQQRQAQAAARTPVQQAVYQAAHHDFSGIQSLDPNLVGQRGGMQTQPVGSPVELNQGSGGFLQPQVQDHWGRSPSDPAYGQDPNGTNSQKWDSGSPVLGGSGYGNPYQSNTGGSGPMWQGSPQDRMIQMGQAQGAYQQAPLGQIRSSPMPQWGRGMMLGSPFSPMRQQMGQMGLHVGQGQQQPRAQQSSAYSGGLGQLVGRAPWPPQGFTGLVR